jgi:ABC-2 type transport system ATP-binding protein
VGRKEILDILLSVKEQTTVLFSTHILSDVERICTDVAFLKDGAVDLQGPLAQIRSRYRRQEYLLEAESREALVLLQQTFPGMRPQGQTQLIFRENENTLFDVLRFVTDRKLPLLKLERIEPTLESLFMEVVEK